MDFLSRKNNRVHACLLVCGSLLLSGLVSAQDYYFSGSLGVLEQGNSSNAGMFAEEFLTGEVTGVTPAQTIAAGSGISWETEFERGDFYSLALGAYAAGMRYELEFRGSEADVEQHTGFGVAGVDLSGVDAGALVTGNTDDLGITVGELLSVGRGELKTESLMLNGYWDFDTTTFVTSYIQPYVGLGVGNADSEIRYAPSNVPILNGSENGFAWQAIVGASFQLVPQIEITLSYRYFAAEDFDIRSSALPADFEIENSAQTFDLGLRFSF